MIPYALLRSVSAHAVAFFERLEKQEFTAYTSVLTFDELAYRSILALIKEKYGGSPLDLYRAEQQKMSSEFAPRVIAELERLRAYTNLIVLDIVAQDLEQMSDAMLKYQILPRDALHYAAMSRVECFNLASSDAHFDRIPTVKRYTL